MRASFISVTSCLLVLLASACTDDVPTAVVPSAPVTPAAVPAALVATSPTALSATVGATIMDPPAVILRDARGAAMPGFDVTFTVTRGGGVIVGTTVRTTLVTDASGTARLGSWTLGSRPGAHEVTAQSGTLAPVTFTAAAVAGPPAVMEKFHGDGQFAAQWSTLGARPAVYVADAFGNPLGDVRVTFFVSAGGGSIADTVVLTDAMGSAAVGRWTLGSDEQQALTATADALRPVVFVARAIRVVAACQPSGALTVTAMRQSELTQRSCQDSAGRLIETFVMTSPSNDAYEFMLGSAFEASLEIRDHSGRPVAASEKDSRLKVLLPAGVFTVVASSARPGVQGAYSLSYQLVSAHAAGCATMSIARGVTTPIQAITSKDCVISDDRADDQFRVWAARGESLNISLEDWSYSDHTFEVVDGTGRHLGTSAYSGGYAFGLIFTAPADGYYVIRVYGSPNHGLEYKLTVK